ncbi:transposase [Streptomyces lydicus]|uniref:transposase n=1 Tax=Streptomyces lydicus TaxID=47763 RepID=UPI0034309C25
MRVRDEPGELFADAEFAEAFESRGRPGWSPGQLALVTVLQFAENLTDRAAAHRVRYGMDLKYALGLASALVHQCAAPGEADAQLLGYALDLHARVVSACTRRTPNRSYASCRTRLLKTASSTAACR